MPEIQTYIYVIGLQQMGGCWMANGDFYSTFEEAEQEAKRRDCNEKVFTLYLKTKKEI